MLPLQKKKVVAFLSPPFLLYTTLFFIYYFFINYKGNKGNIYIKNLIFQGFRGVTFTVTFMLPLAVKVTIQPKKGIFLALIS